MKLNKVEQYSAGYSKESLLKKCAAGALGVAMLGTLTGCFSYAGGLEAYGGGEEYDGGEVCVSESDTVEKTLATETGHIEPKTAAESGEES